MHETIQKLTKIQRELTQENGESPTFEQIAKKALMRAVDVENAFKIAKDPVSLDITVGEENSTYRDFIEDETILSPEEDADNNDLRNSLLDIIEQLPRKEREVVRLRYGMYDLNVKLIENQIKEYQVFIKFFTKKHENLPEVYEYINNLKYFSAIQREKLANQIMSEDQSGEKLTKKITKYGVEIETIKCKLENINLKEVNRVKVIEAKKKENKNALVKIKKLKADLKELKKQMAVKTIKASSYNTKEAKMIVLNSNLKDLETIISNNQKVLAEKDSRTYIEKIKERISRYKKEIKKNELDKAILEKSLIKKKKKIVIQISKKLDGYEKDLRILTKLIKLTDGEIRRLTLEEVGKLHNVTRERIRQIENKGKRKMKAYAEEKRLDLYM